MRFIVPFKTVELSIQRRYPLVSESPRRPVRGTPVHLVRSARRIHDVSMGRAARAAPLVGGSALPNLTEYFRLK